MTNEPLAKPSGITLKDHIAHVVAEGQMLTQRLPITFDKYLKLTGKDLRKRLNGACLFHDDGKEHEKWQSGVVPFSRTLYL